MSWEKVKLGKFLKVRDNRFKPNDIAISDLKRIDKIDFSGEIFLSDKPSNTDMILIKKGDLVISGINVEKGAMTVYTGENDITATIHYSSYSYDGNKIDIDFLKYFLKSIEFKNALKEQVPGGIKTEIKPKHLLPLFVEIPTDINDQKAVVKVLQNRNSKVDAISTELSHQLSLVKKLRQQLLQDAVQGKLVEQNPKDEPASELLKKIKAEKEKLISEKKLKKEKELPPIKANDIPFEIPESWVWCGLGEIIFDTEGGKSPNCLHEPAKGKEWGVIKTTAVQEMYFLENENKVLPNNFIISEQHKVLEGDVLITRAGPKNRVGIVCCVENLTKNLILSDKTIRIKHSKELLSPKYIAMTLNSPLIKPLIELKMTGMADSQVNISQDNMKGFPVPLPPLLEQHRIVQKLEELMQNYNELEESIKQSASQNERLLQQVLREALQPKN
jgi:type I restriction enzyme S subunit